MNKNVLIAALNLLARREHSAAELLNKLLQRKFEDVQIKEVISYCQEKDYQSDLRYAENLCRTRMNQGYGERRIRYELSQKWVDVSIIDQVLSIDPEVWQEHMQKVIAKKFKNTSPKTLLEKQKIRQFLYTRGFNPQ